MSDTIIDSTYACVAQARTQEEGCVRPLQPNKKKLKGYWTREHEQNSIVWPWMMVKQMYPDKKRFRENK